MQFVAKNFDELTTAELYEILRSRCEVFLLEQHIVCQDMDGIDYKSRHYFFWENGRVVACLRAYFTDEENRTVKIGRVLTIRHGCGAGRELVSLAFDDIRMTMGGRKITVSAQKQAVGFYEKMGFKPTSGEFLEEGVVHVDMALELNE